MAPIILLIMLALAVALQFLIGDFPVGFFSFPLNVILLAVWFLVVLWLWKDKRKSVLVSHLLSIPATIASIILVLGVCLVIGFTGMRWLAHSWFFVCILLYLQTVLLFVILRGCREATPTGARLGPVRWRFLMLHVGILLTLVSGFWGAPDEYTVAMKASQGLSVSEGYHMDGTPAWVGHEVELIDFVMDKYENDMPSDYRAELLVDEVPVTLRVNHPYSLGKGSQLYLSGYDVTAGNDSDYCVLHIVHEPWRFLTVSGICLMLAGALLLFLGGPGRRYHNED